MSESVMLLDAEQIVTSHSIDGTFESCPRRFEFLHMWLKAPESESDSYAADVGTALHEASQQFLRCAHSKSMQDTALAEEEAAMTLLKWWPWEVEDRMRRESKAIGQRTIGNAFLMLDEIQNSMAWRDWELVEIENFGPAIEVPYRIIHKSFGTVPTPRGTQAFFVTQGKMDLILRHRMTRKYRVWDLKTTVKSIPAHDASFRFSGQGGLYGLVLSHALGVDWKQHGLEVTYLMAYFSPENGPTVYPLDYALDPEEIQDAIDVKLERLQRMKDYAIRAHWPRRAHGCEFYGTPCGFLDICQRRDESFIKEWFKFEEASGRFKHYSRIYEPVWVLEA